MKRHMRALALCLCLLLMLPVFSGAAAQAQDSGLVLSKSSEYDAASQTVRLTLEAYTTGQIVTERVSTPCDVALVLDESGSMAYSIGTTPVYAPALETDKTYYLVTDSGGSQAVTYQSGAWGYTSWGTRYTVQPTTGPDDPDGSHTQLYAGAQTRKAAIIAAVNAFLTQMEAENANLTADVTPHRVGIVGFSSESGARIIRPLSTDLAAVSDGTLNTNGGTYINKGLELVDALFDAGASAVTGEQRSRVVIAFTDGNPGTGSWSADGTKQCAANAIQLAGALKTGGVKIYTVGIFSGANPADLTGAANQYMNAMSSNYPDATAAYADGAYSVSLGARAEEGSYYLSASSTEALEGIFEAIASQTGGAAVSLDSSAVVLDEISDAFTLPADADAGSISVTTQDADYSTGALCWKDSTITGFDPTVTVEGNIVRVTGFDFNRNFVAQQGRTEGSVTQPGDFYGRKLIISFTVLPKDGLMGGDVATNGPASGVYDAEGNCVDSFEVPTVDVPLQPVTPVTADQALYLGESLRLDTLLPDPDAGLDGVHNTADLTYTIRDGAQTIGTYTVRAGETSGAWVWAADYTNDHFYDGTVTPEYASKTYTIECTVSGGGKTATASADATVTVHTCSLTIQKRGWDAQDENQSFLLRVQGAGNVCAGAVSMQVAVQGNGSVTITGLPVGSYTVTEDALWSWRYAPGEPAAATLTGAFGQDSAAVTVDSSRTAQYWLTGGSLAVSRLVAG